MKKLMTLALILAPLSALAGTEWQSEGKFVVRADYSCGGDLGDASVVYATAPDGTSFATLLLQGKLVALHQVPAGSGVLYMDTDEQGGYRIHAKGDQMLLLQLAPGDGEEEKLLAECKEKQG